MRNTALPQNELKNFCRRWKVKELALFGSILRADFRPQSDIDVLVTFESGERWSLLDIARMKNELGELLGRKVDLAEKKVIEKSRNWIRRKAILESAEVVYAAR